MMKHSGRLLIASRYGESTIPSAVGSMLLLTNNIANTVGVVQHDCLKSIAYAILRPGSSDLPKRTVICIGRVLEGYLRPTATRHSYSHQIRVLRHLRRRFQFTVHRQREKPPETQPDAQDAVSRLCDKSARGAGGHIFQRGRSIHHVCWPAGRS